MIEKFCPKCGSKLQNNICQNCIEEVEDIKFPNLLIQISEFNRVWDKGVWRNFNDLETELINQIKRHAGEDTQVIIEPFEFEAKPKEKIKIKAQLIKDDHTTDIEFTLGYRQCDFGQKQKTEYFEGILQLRNSKEFMIEYINREMEQLAPKGVFITKISEQRNGVDLYFTNKTQMHLLGQRLVSVFGGKITAHPQLFSHNHQTSKDIYRLNVLVEFTEFQKGDVIKLLLQKHTQPIYVHIKSMGKIIHGKNISTQKTLGFELKNAQEIEIVKTYETQVMNTKPSIEVMDPETYQMQSIANKELFNEYNPQDRVKIVKTPIGVFILE